MKTRQVRKFHGAVLLAAAVFVLGAGSCIYVGSWEGGQEKYERRIELTESMAGLDAFKAQTENGAITLRGESTGDCRMEAVITGQSFTAERAQALAEAAEVSLVREGDRLRAEIRRPAMERGESVSVALDVTVPHETAAELHSTNGRISAADLAGSAAAHSSNGSVELTNIKGDVTAHTTNGQVLLRQITAGQMDLKSTNGTLRGEQVQGSLQASTTNGSVNMVYAPDAAGKTDIRISTTNGSIHLTVPADYSARVDASTENGRIHSDLPVTVSGTLDKSIRGTIGSGEGRLHLTTTNGSIGLHAR